MDSPDDIVGGRRSRRRSVNRRLQTIYPINPSAFPLLFDPAPPQPAKPHADGNGGGNVNDGIAGVSTRLHPNNNKLAASARKRLAAMGADIDGGGGPAPPAA